MTRYDLVGLLIGVVMGAGLTVVAWALCELDAIAGWRRRRATRRAQRAVPLPPATVWQLHRAARANRLELPRRSSDSDSDREVN